MDVHLDPSWVDAKQFASQSTDLANSGLGPELQQLWTALQPGGYNVVRFALNISDTGAAANRAANVCLWAKSNNVKLILVLNTSDDEKPIDGAYPDKVSSFIKALTTLLLASNGQYSAAYEQIMAYQLDDELNHPGRHGGMSGETARQVALKAAHELRTAEKEALAAVGIEPTPLLASASFDFQLIKAGAIMGNSLSDEMYSQAYKALADFLAPLAASPDIDVLSIDWFPGSLSSGGAEKFPVLLRSLVSDLGGKQLIVTTGFSTAFRTAEDQKSFYALAFTTASDYRASVGLDCPFLGIVFHQAFPGKEPNPDPPRPGLPSEMAKWDWSAKANELTRMWTEKKKSPEITWWLKKTESNMGVVSWQADSTASPSIVPAPAQQTMREIASDVSNANAAGAGSNNSYDATAGAAGAGAETPGQPSGNTSSGAGSGLTTSLAAKAQQGLLGLLDVVFQRLGNEISGGCVSFGYSNSMGSYSSSSANGTGLPTAAPCNNGTGFGNSYPGGQYPVPPPSPGDQQNATQGTPAQPFIQLADQDITVAPANPTVGMPAKFTVNLRNKGKADAFQVQVSSVIEGASIFAEPVDIRAGETRSATLNWIPPDAKSYQVTFAVADASGNQQASLAREITAQRCLICGSQNNPQSNSTGGGIDRDLNTVVNTPPGSVRFAGSHWGNFGQELVAGQSMPFTITLFNPYVVNFSNVSAALLLDGKPVQTQLLSRLFPGQNRSLLFSAITIPQAGKHEVKIMLKSQRPGTQPQPGTVISQITVLDASKPAAGHGVRSIVGPANVALPATAQPRLVRSILPPAFRVGRLSMPSQSGSSPRLSMPVTPNRASGAFQNSQTDQHTPTLTGQNGPAPAPSDPNSRQSPGEDPRRIGLPMPAPAAMHPDLSVSAQEIGCQSFVAPSGQLVRCTALVRNLGNGIAHGATLTFKLFANGNLVASSPLIGFDLQPAGASFQQSWQTSIKPARTLQVQVLAEVNDDSNPTNNHAMITIVPPRAPRIALPPPKLGPAPR
jgi:hypothetical protein